MRSRRRNPGRYGSWRLRLVWLAAMAMGTHHRVSAHEGHAALPTKGATVQGNQLLISAKALKAIGVECAKVTLGDLRQVVRARARVELPWYQNAMIATVVPGRIERVSVRPGEIVKAGQELARVESLDLEDFQRDLLRADAELVLAQRICEQREELGRQDAISKVDVLQARHKRDEAAAQVVVATQKLLALALDRTEITRLRETKRPLGVLPIVSPIDGVISHADFRAGQGVTTDQHLYHVVDPTKVSIVAEVLESDVALVGVDRPIRATFRSMNTSIDGHIDHVHPALNPKSRTREAVAHITNPDNKLRPGQTGRVEIEVGRVKQGIICPAKAIIQAAGGPFVLVRRGEGRFDRRRVTTGLLDGLSVEIKDGLFPGDQVVVVGKQLLAAMFHNEAQTPTATRSTRTASGHPDERLSRRPVIQGVVEIPTQAKHRLAPRIDGRLARILVEPGQRVEAGQVLAEIDSLPLRNLQLEFLRTRLEREWTSATVSRLRSLVAVGAAVAKRELWEREGESVVIETNLANLRAKLLAVGLRPESLARLEAVSLASEPKEGVIASTVPLRARAAGIVSHFDVIPGQVVRPSNMLFEIQDPSRIWVRGHAFERDASGLRVGSSVNVTFPCLPDHKVRGTIVRLAPELDPRERVLPLWVEVDNPGGVLPEGAMARITLEVEPTEDDQLANWAHPGDSQK